MLDARTSLLLSWIWHVSPQSTFARTTSLMTSKSVQKSMPVQFSLTFTTLLMPTETQSTKIHLKQQNAGSFSSRTKHTITLQKSNHSVELQPALVVQSAILFLDVHGFTSQCALPVLQIQQYHLQKHSRENFHRLRSAVKQPRDFLHTETRSALLQVRFRKSITRAMLQSAWNLVPLFLLLLLTRYSAKNRMQAM